MTITMTSKNQITIPKKIVDALDLDKGAILDVRLVGGRIELVPLEVVERVYTNAEYKKLEELYQKEKKAAKKADPKSIDRL